MRRSSKFGLLPTSPHFSYFRKSITALATLTLAAGAQAQVDLDRVAQFHDPAAQFCVQEEMMSITDPQARFLEAFECGDELFATTFNALDGIGAKVGDGSRFARVPRADLTGAGEWADHFPKRATGPNAEACTTCHNLPFEDGAGLVALNAVRDPLHTGNPGKFITRNTPHVFALGGVQLLAEEMTTELQAIRASAIDQAAGRGNGNGRRGRVTLPLVAKGISFGSITARPNGSVDTSAVTGVDSDLVVKPFQWKGSVATLRQFSRDAFHNELGMQTTEIVGDDIDGDGDGVTNELDVGDQSAMAIYIAAQPRPVTQLELHNWGVVTLTQPDIASINRGEQVFERIGCADCHTPSLTVNNPVFTEPSQHPSYRDSTFPAGQDPIARSVDPADPIGYNLTIDPPSNIIEVNGNSVNIGVFEADAQGRALVRLYSDLKRHDMGPGLAESIDEVGTGASVWKTQALWGVGSTGPYLHDGRATTLTEAILFHGGAAEQSRVNAENLRQRDHADLIRFLNNLVLYKIEEEHE
jgi:cytochrome c peroxidase